MASPPSAGPHELRPRYIPYMAPPKTRSTSSVSTRAMTPRYNTRGHDLDTNYADFGLASVNNSDVLPQVRSHLSL